MLPREDILAPHTGRQFSGIFVRKSRTKTGNERFYLYEEGSEDLILVAEEESSYHFNISQSALDMSPTSKFFLGVLYANKGTLTWKAADFQSRAQVTITYLKASEREEGYRELQVVIPPDLHLRQRHPRNIDGRYLIQFPTSIRGVKSEKNIIIDNLDGHFTIVFQKAAEKEHVLLITEPCSIFQGFCVALSTFRRFNKE